jgi:hypothetical protein
MANLPPIIYLIHASDAPQHIVELKTILLRMKAENRISDVKAIDVTSSSILSLNSENSEGIIVLLTYEMQRTRGDIEKLMNNINKVREAKLIEVIVDNVPYHNDFISFPQDLKPIRLCDNMDLVWLKIEQNLNELFPRPHVEAAENDTLEHDTLETLKPIGIAVATGAFQFLKFVGAIILYFFLSTIFWATLWLFSQWTDSWGLFFLVIFLNVIALMIYRHWRTRAKMAQHA